VRRETTCEQCGDGFPMGIQVAAGGEVRVQHAFQEGEGPGELGRLGEVGELLPGVSAIMKLSSEGCAAIT
jgi:hypothetical protein